MSVNNKQDRRSRRRRSIRKNISGTAERPRLTVSRSIKHIYVQAVDDTSGQTIASASSLNDDLVGQIIESEEGSRNVVASKAVGKAVAQRLKEKNVDAVVFDRNGYLYHGRISAVADGAREGGLKF